MTAGEGATNQTEGAGGDGGGSGEAGGGSQAPGNGKKPPDAGNNSKQQSLPPKGTEKGEENGAGSQAQKRVGSAEPVGPDDDQDQEDDEILEESPCKRWSKRREKVKQRDVPGIDAAFLAMDNETGNEVVWNEVLFSERKNFREQEEKIRAVFDNLTRLEHPNLVKFHKYWIDQKSDKPRIVFITEYMSSGSMSRFLQRARSSGTLLNIKAWRNWTRQILNALFYLHSCDPPIVHANLTCNTIFIQQNGLVKIGCVAPNTIHHHVKTFRENIKNIHYLAPEFDHLTEATTQADIYSFGVCALEMATTGAIQSGSLNGGSSQSGEKATAATADAATSTTGTSGFHMVTEEMLHKAMDSLEDGEQKEIIEKCLEQDPAKRSNVTELLDRLGPPEAIKLETSLEEQEDYDELVEPPAPPSRATSPQENTNATAAAYPTATAVGRAAETTTASKSVSPPMTATAAPISQQQDGYQQHQMINSSTSTSTIHPTVSSSTALAAPIPATIITTTTTAAITAMTTNSNNICTGGGNNNIAIHTSASAASTLSPPQPQQQFQQQQQSVQLDEGYHTAQSMVDGPAGTSGGPQLILSGEPLMTTAGSGTSVNAPPQHREMRQVLQMNAEMLEGRQLRVQLQLDDQMNRQLTAQLRDEDTAETLANELVQHGFICETNLNQLRDLLTNVLSSATAAAAAADSL